ncbi:MAG: cytochrome C [Elusimicrobia bacterium CG_4_10_14_0_2_um_filter_56_8]|nr:MAG: hypothetical protein AUJ51_08115 [Elusimicrobia bacterium CG1_02_56_21]PJA15060.1 MAG: cytochrome C [Elusimicrobia bacterium CG_4_10_14_0_2_um_filter_56_8]
MIKRTAAISGILLLCGQAMPSFAAEASRNYKSLCVSCHGKDAKGVPAMTKVFKVAPSEMDLTSEEVQAKADADLAKAIHDGKGKMPAFKNKLSDKQIAELVKFVKTPGAAQKP